MTGIQRSFDAAKRALERVAEASQKPAVDSEKQEKKETEKVEDSKDKAALTRVKDKEVKPRSLDKDAQHNPLSTGFGDALKKDGTQTEKRLFDPGQKPQDKKQKADKEWEKAAKGAKKAAERAGAIEKQTKKQESQSTQNEFLVSLYGTQDYYSLAAQDDPELQKLEKMLGSINGNNSKEVNQKNYAAFDKQLEQYTNLLARKDKRLTESVMASLIYRLHEKVRNSPKLQSQGFEAKPLPPSMKPRAVILEARAESDDKYYSGLLTAIAGNTVYVSTTSYVRDANSRMLDLNEQEIEQVRQENEVAKKNMSGLEILVEDSLDSEIGDPKKAKKVIEAASTNILRKKIEQEIKEVPQANTKQESRAQAVVNKALKGLKNIDDAFNTSIASLKEKEPKLKDILKKFKSLKKGAKPEVNSEIVNEIIASLGSVKSTYAKELVLYSLKLKAKEIDLDSEVSKLDGKLKTLQSTKVDPRDRLYANWLQVTFIHAGFHRPGKKPKHIQEDLKSIKKYFAKHFKEPEAKVEALVNREYRYFSDKYPKRIDV